MTALDIAINEIGYVEQPTNKTKYGKWYGSDGVPWCMEFVQYCFSMATTPVPYKTASCSSLLTWYKKNIPAAVSSTPKRNAIIIYNFGHTGICESFDKTTVTAIEGNTSDKGSQDNGGMVMRKTRKRSTVTAYIDTEVGDDRAEGSQVAMKAVKGSTSNETALIKSVQTAIGAIADGEIGCQTMSDIACKLNAIKSPVTLSIYSAPVIIASDLKVIASPKKSLSSFANSVNGGFYASGSPCSICVASGQTVHATSAHYWDGVGYPETVIYRESTGHLGVKRVKSVSELPNCKWAVGAMGLLDYYDPNKEGFCKIGNKDFSDVLRRTNHSVLGVKNNYIYLVYAKNKTASEVNDLAKKLGFSFAIMLDGGSICGMNGTELFAKINTKVTQYFVLQAV